MAIAPTTHLPRKIVAPRDAAFPAAKRAVRQYLEELILFPVYAAGGNSTLVAVDELQRTQECATTIKMSAKDRLLAFLRDWSKRSGTYCVRLSVGYQDIADYLGINIEALSRTITELEQSGVLARTSSRRMLTFKKSLSAV